MIVPFKEVLINRSPSSDGSKNLVPLSEIRATVSSAVQTGYDSIQFISENPRYHIDPMWREDIAEILEYALELDVQRIMFESNLHTELTPNDINDLSVCGVMFYRVPVFSSKAKIHDSYANSPESLERTKLGISYLQRAKIQGTDRPPFLLIDCYLFQDTYRQLKDLIQLCIDLHADAITVTPIDVNIPYSQLSPLLDSCLDMCIQNTTWLEIRGLPLCQFKQAPYFLREYYALDYEMVKKRHIPRCTSCTGIHRCGGVNPQYAAIHGDAEIGPLDEDINSYSRF